MSNVLFHGDLGALFTALHAAQGEISGYVKDEVNPAFKSDYASIEAVIDAVKPALYRNGLVVTQHIGETIEGDASLTTVLSHTSGAYMLSTGSISRGRKRGPQDDGSANTYMRRYALCSLLMLKEADDDANLASGLDSKGKPVPQDSNMPKQTGKRGGGFNKVPPLSSVIAKKNAFDKAIEDAGYDTGLIAELFESESWPHWSTKDESSLPKFKEFLKSKSFKDKLLGYIQFQKS